MGFVNTLVDKIRDNFDISTNGSVKRFVTTALTSLMLFSNVYTINIDNKYSLKQNKNSISKKYNNNNFNSNRNLERVTIRSRIAPAQETTFTPIINGNEQAEVIWPANQDSIVINSNVAVSEEVIKPIEQKAYIIAPGNLTRNAPLGFIGKFQGNVRGFPEKSLTQVRQFTNLVYKKCHFYFDGLKECKIYNNRGQRVKNIGEAKRAEVELARGVYILKAKVDINTAEQDYVEPSYLTRNLNLDIKLKTSGNNSIAPDTYTVDQTRNVIFSHTELDSISAVLANERTNFGNIDSVLIETYDSKTQKWGKLIVPNGTVEEPTVIRRPKFGRTIATPIINGQDSIAFSLVYHTTEDINLRTNQPYKTDISSRDGLQRFIQKDLIIDSCLTTFEKAMYYIHAQISSYGNSSYLNNHSFYLISDDNHLTENYLTQLVRTLNEFFIYGDQVGVPNSNNVYEKYEPVFKDYNGRPLSNNGTSLVVPPEFPIQFRQLTKSQYEGLPQDMRNRTSVLKVSDDFASYWGERDENGYWEKQSSSLGPVIVKSWHLEELTSMFGNQSEIGNILIAPYTLVADSPKGNPRSAETFLGFINLKYKANSVSPYNSFMKREILNGITKYIYSSRTINNNELLEKGEFSIPTEQINTNYNIYPAMTRP